MLNLWVLISAYIYAALHKAFHISDLISTLVNPVRYILPCYRLENWNSREFINVKWLVPSHTTSKYQAWDLNLSFVTPMQSTASVSCCPPWWKVATEAAEEFTVFSVYQFGCFERWALWSHVADRPTQLFFGLTVSQRKIRNNWIACCFSTLEEIYETITAILEDHWDWWIIDKIWVIMLVKVLELLILWKEG